MSIRAHGPWVHVEVLPPDDPYGIQTMMSGQYVSDGISCQRLGYARARVLSAGDFYTERTPKGPKEVRTPPDVRPGSIVWFRGYLAELLRLPSGASGCFIHQNTILLVETD